MAGQAASPTLTPGLRPLPVLALLRVTEKTHRRIILNVFFFFFGEESTGEFVLDRSERGAAGSLLHFSF